MRDEFRVKIQVSWLVVCALMLLALPLRAQDATPDAAFTARTYEVHVPQGYDAAQAVPLVMVLHGAGGHGKRSETWLGFDDVADKQDFIVVYPDGLYNNWDFGAGVPTPDGSIQVDDVGYLTWVVGQLEQQYNID